MIYLDNQSTTRCDPRVVKAMLPYFSENYGNASSKTHSFGWVAEAAVDLAREQVASALGAQTNEIVFCSGATEANNLALRGAAMAYQARGKHLVIAATEHASVLDCAKQLESEGWSLTLVPVDAHGHIKKDALLAALRDDTSVVSIMLANNETGVIQNISALGALVHQHQPAIIFHCDAAQALGKIPVDVHALGVDLLSVSGHKVYGPKGVGALWRRRRPRLVLRPLQVGGGQEEAVRPGTLAVPLIVGFGQACALACAELKEEIPRLTALRDLLLAGLRRKLDVVHVNGCMNARVPGNLNLAFPGVSADRLVLELRDIACSTGSACASATGKPSHVLAAMVDKAQASQSIRFGLGRFTTQSEILKTIALVAGAVGRLQR